MRLYCIIRRISRLTSLSSEIEGNITLLSSHRWDGTFGAFTIDASTTHSPVHFAFPAAPPHSQLRLSGRTSHAPIRADMHGTFEGTFHLYNDGAPPPTVSALPADDPAHLQRPCDIVLYRTEDTAVQGSVKWVPSMLEDGQGSVELSTTGGACELLL